MLVSIFPSFFFLLFGQGSISLFQTPARMTLSMRTVTAGVKEELLKIFGESKNMKTATEEYDSVLASPGGNYRIKTLKRKFGAVDEIVYKISENDERYLVARNYVDFVGTDEKYPWERSPQEQIMEGTFQNPVVSSIYERGWRNAFRQSGFPGIEKEFEELNDFFISIDGPDSVVVDLSCGSGLMTRKLQSCKKYGRVIGADLSLTMLQEAVQRFKNEKLEQAELLRCDVSKLPFLSESVDGIHAGAALHCWSKIEESLAEVYRVLKRGGLFFASTFGTGATIFSNSNNGMRLFTIEHLNSFLKDAGFAEVSVDRRGRGCLIAKCRKM